MVDESDRMTRASKYVLGLMDDDERARAERDLELDTDFRDAMMQVAGRMHLFDLDRPHKGEAAALRTSINAHLAALPHIQVAEPAEGRSLRPVPVQAAAPGADGRWRRLGPGWRGSIVALSLLAACGIGYAAGSIGGGTQPAECGVTAK